METEMTHVSDDDLTLHYYGELDAPARTRVDEHLAECEACRAAEIRLRLVLATVSELPVPEADAGFERAVWARLEPALERRRGTWWQVWTWTPARLGATAAVAVLVVAAFAVGWYWRAPALPDSGAATSERARADQEARDRILLVAVGEHLQQTEMVLVELVNADGPDTVNISAARTQAAELVADNRLYRQTAATSGDAAIVGVLEELERALIEVAGCPSEVPRRDLDTILRGIEAPGLIFKLRVVGQQVREWEESAGPPTRRAES